jgi:hypothetical protein
VGEQAARRKGDPSRIKVASGGQHQQKPGQQEQKPEKGGQQGGRPGGKPSASQISGKLGVCVPISVGGVDN